jgi:hypothetical protein
VLVEVANRLGGGIMPKKSNYLVCALLLLNGCAGGTRWAHNSYSEAQFQLDSRRCDLVANQLISQQPSFQPSQIDPTLTPFQQSAIGAQNAGGFLGDGLSKAIGSTRIYQDCLFSLGYRRE